MAISMARVYATLMAHTRRKQHKKGFPCPRMENDGERWRTQRRSRPTCQPGQSTNGSASTDPVNHSPAFSPHRDDRESKEASRTRGVMVWYALSRSLSARGSRVPKRRGARPPRVLCADATKPPRHRLGGLCQATGRSRLRQATFGSAFGAARKHSLSADSRTRKLESQCPLNKEWSRLRGLEDASGWTVFHVRTVHARVGWRSQPYTSCGSQPTAQKPPIGGS
jgi:hypothetical protein